MGVISDAANKRKAALSKPMAKAPAPKPVSVKKKLGGTAKNLSGEAYVRQEIAYTLGKRKRPPQKPLSPAAKKQAKRSQKGDSGGR